MTRELRPPSLSASRRRPVLVGPVIVNLALFATLAAMISVLLPGRVAAL